LENHKIPDQKIIIGKALEKTEKKHSIGNFQLLLQFGKQQQHSTDSIFGKV